MKVQEIEERFRSELQELYNPHELDQLLHVIWEDLFGGKGYHDRTLHSREIETFTNAITQLKNDVPIQYITNISYFYNLKIKVDSNVLIPRPETEELVFHFLSSSDKGGLRVLDIGTGSGCIALAINSKRPDYMIIGIDVSPEAIKIAHENAEKNELFAKFEVLDFLDVQKWNTIGEFDRIICNPPYISRSEKGLMSESTLKYEPDLALYPNSDDVLIFYKRIAEFGKSHLALEGEIYLECNEFNSEEVAELFEFYDYYTVELIEDLQGKNRFVKVTKT